ncbi:MAG TPA: hypothetical protein VGQ71_11190, partial [Terriglobales bacterium]|nr:hypothetical protein [Terriglobales bacterium]
MSPLRVWRGPQPKIEMGKLQKTLRERLQPRRLAMAVRVRLTATEKSDIPMPLRAKLFVYLTAAVGFGVVVAGLAQWESQDLLRFVCYLGIAMLASGLKVQLPGIDGTMS